ncbi:MAG: hypothetical protein AAGA50_14180 [Pseudomonadota bacterium]
MRLKSGFFSAALAATALFALAPVAFNLVIDAYDRNDLFALGLDKREISVKAHYPLYKMIEYPKVKAPTVILGDSRARALQDKYWQELGRTDVYNFAYGGATVYEIYETFKYLRDTSKLETLIVSLPLRSMDKRFKGGMNRVPEALALANDPFAYYTNWFVAKVGWQLLQDKFPGSLPTLDMVSLSPVNAAQAADFNAVAPLSVEALLDPALCEDCTLTTMYQPLRLPVSRRHHGWGYGQWAAYWPEINLTRDLPRLFAKQVGTNGAADWRRFKQSEDLWAMIEEIAEWCDRNGVKLVFVIPPTISEMQRRISDFGLARANHDFRERLSGLGPVVDLDFDAEFSRNIENFTDAYHFGSGPARRIVGELLLLIEDDDNRIAAATERREDLVCPISPKDTTRSHRAGTLELLEGKSCRIWRQTNG